MALCNYKVFLSFRGPDTRHNLVNYLYKQLQGLQIVSFLDSEEIEHGDVISAKIVDAIERSDICIPIFSLDFASSTACLKEVAQMVRSKKKIHPIFFFVEPGVVKYQQGTYAKSFAEHKCKRYYSASTIKDWRKALEKIADKRGPEFKKADLEAPLKAALDAALGGIDGIAEPVINKAALEVALKAALEAALGEIGVIKGPGVKKAALGDIGAPKGRFYNDLFSGFRELEVFISKIWKLSRGMVDQGLTRNLVGIERDVPDMMRKLGFDYEDGRAIEQLAAKTSKRVLVVWGMPQVGKTTLAKVVFHKISHLFQGHSLLENVRGEFEQNREVSLQNQLIRELKGGGNCPEVKSSYEGTRKIQCVFQGKKVLILLDDVDDVDQFKQIETLATQLPWFGPGSAIILTTRRTDVTEFYRNLNPQENEGDVFNEHKVSSMNEDHALEHFHKHAFPMGCPLGDYENWSRKIISDVGFHPFAIKVLGKYLCGKRVAEDWEETLKGLNESSEEKLKPILMKHFDSLRDHENARNIFLDIACFFTGVEKTIPCEMWDAHGWNPRRSVGDLENMSFLEIGEENEFSMHNQLKLLGREIVKKENPDNPGERSRLWDHKDVQTTLNGKKVADKVKALCVGSNFNKVDGAEFFHVPNLRFLELDEVDIEGNAKNILPDLVWLDWRGHPKKSSGCPEKSKLFAFGMKKLVILKLCSRPDRLTLDEWGQLLKDAACLQVLNLKDCRWINASLEFCYSSLLKRLTLEGCLHFELNTTNSNFKNLVSFNMKGCKWVKHLPRALHSMKALEELLIDGTKIGKLQFEEGSLPALETLSACDCGELLEVTHSIRFLKKLKKLFLKRCIKLNTLPCVFGELGQLQEMDLSYTSISELPPCVEHCENLQVLKMVRTNLKAFPEAIKHLKELRELDFTLCKGLRGKRCDITGLFSLRILRLKNTGITEVLARDEAKFCLHILELDHGITKLTRPGQKGTSVPKLKRERQTGTSQKNSCVSQNKKKRGEE